MPNDLEKQKANKSCKWQLSDMFGMDLLKANLCTFSVTGAKTRQTIHEFQSNVQAVKCQKWGLSKVCICPWKQKLKSFKSQSGDTVFICLII